jgi:hypothetical protein
MPGRPTEQLAQREFTLRLRFAIDTARKYPTQRNQREAIELAESQPRALRSSHTRHNLGAMRWEWLTLHGVTAVGEAGELEGEFKGTITPEVTK